MFERRREISCARLCRSPGFRFPIWPITSPTSCKPISTAGLLEPGRPASTGLYTYMPRINNPSPPAPSSSPSTTFPTSHAATSAFFVL